MNISLPDTLKSFVDEQVSQRGYGTSSECVRQLIRKDQDLQQLRGLLLAGAASPPSAPADGAYCWPAWPIAASTFPVTVSSRLTAIWKCRWTNDR